MCVVKLNKTNEKCINNINRNQMGPIVRNVLIRAKVEHRLICGLLPALSYLEKHPDNVQLCVLPQTQPGDATTHLQGVLLKAFCYENFIPVIQVDSSKKLTNYCAICNECTCAIIINDNNCNNSELSTFEQDLISFYQCTLDECPQPIIELPI